MKRRTQGVSLLAMVLSALVILVAIIGALHYSEQVARRNNLGAEAELQLVQSRRWELGYTMNKLPRSVQPTNSLEVQASMRATANGTVIPPNSGAKLFESGSDSIWNGLPDLLITRSNAVLEPSPPPASTEYRDTAVSSNSALRSTFSGRYYRYIVSSMAPYAAYAPHGSITLDKVVGWSNPKMSEDTPLELFSGLPTVVAAAETVNVTDMPYGTIYSRKHDADAIQFTNGLVIPLARRFPVRPFENAYASNISTNRDSLALVAAARSNKTQFIGGDPPGVDTLLGMMTGETPNLTDWLSLRSSLQWKFPTIPGFTTVAVPATYVAFAFWFHAPYPPDGVATGTDPFTELEAKYDRLEALNRRKRLVVRNLRQLRGGPEIPGNEDQKIPAQPAVEGIIPRMNALRPLLEQDRNTLGAVNATTRAATTQARGNMKTTKQLLPLLADGGPRGLLAEPGTTYQPGWVDGGNQANDIMHPNENRVRANNVLNMTSETYPRLESGEVDVSQQPTARFNGNNVSRTDTNALTEPEWKSMLQFRFGFNDFKSNEESQYQFLNFLLEDAKSPFKQYTKWAEDLEAEKAELDEKIEALEGEGGEIQTYLAGLSAAADGDDSLKLRLHEVRTNGRPAPPYSHSRYGYSFDLLWNLIVDGINGNLQRRWQPQHPLVWYGPKDNVQPGVLAATDSFTLRGTFTVPQARTFCYDHRMTVIGDLWLQRGSTMLVRGDLMLTPVQPDPQGPAKMNFFVPSGRLILEEGATLIVEGRFSCSGTKERGSVIVTATPKQLHPVNAAILVGGDVVIPYGVINGLGITDVLPLLGSAGSALNTVVSPLLSSVGPNVAKLVGPFHRRFCFFSQKCTEYQLEIFIGPFGIPIPIMHPWVGLRKNVWVPMYRGLAMFYQVVDNLNMGEYLYPQSDWWPFGFVDGAGQVPILPKIDPNSVITHLRSVTLSLPSASQIGDTILSFWPTLLESVQNTVIKKIMVSLATSLIPYAPPGALDTILTPIFDALDGDESTLDSNDPTSTITSVLNPVIDEIKNRVTDWLLDQSEEAIIDSLAHEVAGVLVSANKISIGMSGVTPYMATGMFFAHGDIDINASYTVGSIISATGSINDPSRGAKTKLLFYPLYSLAGLYKPVTSPAIEGRSPLSSFTGAVDFVKRAGNYEYGKYADPGTGLDVGVPGVTRVTAEGWQ